MDYVRSTVIMSGDSNKEDKSVQADGTETDFSWSEGACTDVLRGGAP